MIQATLLIITVAIAALFLGRKLYRSTFSKKPEECDHCASNTIVKAKAEKI